MKKLQILNPDAEGRSQYFTKDRKTTLSNLAILHSSSVVDDFNYFAETLVIDSFLCRFSGAELEEYLKVRSEKLSAEILDFIRKKNHYWADTGTKVRKNNDFIEIFFDRRATKVVFMQKLEAGRFPLKELEEFKGYIDDGQIIEK